MNTVLEESPKRRVEQNPFLLTKKEKIEGVIRDSTRMSDTPTYMGLTQSTNSGDYESD